ncbi:hypothetical protein D9756_004799 [Leucocoprinus leucothites]|uniref:Transcription factor CBF/NF-Y/archaeal histone domain-containing protein n=1 Tax=Leucocoprinus leucothites TaxID=201217 RepID=A0A8H5G9R6_9AGAR|nr:hypothetical protein D9756_004799 [Leucoagaricus leucothites]
MPRPDHLAVEHLELNINDDSSLDNFTTDVVTTNDVDDAITESEPDAEEEIDQLDSDSDVPQPPAEVPAPNPKKSSQSRSGERRWGHSLLPASRVENILQAEGLTGSNMNVSKEGVFLLSVATEEFIRQFSTLAHGRAQYYNRNMIRYDDLAAVVKNRNDYTFLHDFIPTPRPLHSAFAARNKRERDLIRDDPAMGISQDGHERRSRSPDATTSEPRSLQPAPCPEPQIQPKPQNQARKRQAPKASTSTPPHTASNINIENPVTQPTETWEEYKERSRRLFGPWEGSRPKHSKSSNNLSNGGSSSHSIPLAQSSSNVLAHPHLEDPDDASEVGSRPDVKSRSSPRPTIHQYKVPLTGPASALLQGPGGPFPPPPSSSASSNRHPTTTGRSSSSSAPPPGRTIYSTDINTNESVE